MISDTIQLIVHHSNCLNIIDLQQGRVAHSHKWNLQSRKAPVMYETPFPRKREVTSRFRKYWHRNVGPHKKLYFQPSRRIQPFRRMQPTRRIQPSRRLYEDERDANLKNKISSLMQQTMHNTEEVMQEVEEIKQQFREQQAYKAGFVLSMLKKSREVVNELFNVAIKHRDEWQALEQLKIFEIIVHTNVDTTHLLKQLIDIQNGHDVVLDIPRSSTAKTTTNATLASSESPDTNKTTKDTGIVLPVTVPPPTAAVTLEIKDPNDAAVTVAGDVKKDDTII